MSNPEEPVKKTLGKTEQELPTPKPSYGVFVWAALILLGVYQTISNLLHNVENINTIGRFFISLEVLFGVIFFTVCVWWFFISKKRRRKSRPLSRVLGYIAFAFGSGLITAIPEIFIMNKGSLIATGVQSLIPLVIVVGLIIGAYYSVFERDVLRARESGHNVAG